MKVRGWRRRRQSRVLEKLLWAGFITCLIHHDFVSRDDGKRSVEHGLLVPSLLPAQRVVGAWHRIFGWKGSETKDSGS